MFKSFQLKRVSSSKNSVIVYSARPHVISNPYRPSFNIATIDCNIVTIFKAQKGSKDFTDKIVHMSPVVQP